MVGPEKNDDYAPMPPIGNDACFHFVQLAVVWGCMRWRCPLVSEKHRHFNLEWLLDLRLGDSGSGIQTDRRDAGSWADNILWKYDFNISVLVRDVCRELERM